MSFHCYSCVASFCSFLLHYERAKYNIMGEWLGSDPLWFGWLGRLPSTPGFSRHGFETQRGTETDCIYGRRGSVDKAPNVSESHGKEWTRVQ